MKKDKDLWPSDPTWHADFAPCYTPKEMIDLGIFEGIYTNVIGGIPKNWLKSDKVLPVGSDPDPELNKYKVKSRQSLTVWQENGWTTELSPLGWWQWYCLYFLGRRTDEDEWQIQRWSSFVSRHQGQINHNCNLKDETCRPKQRQGLLQWAWDSSKRYEARVIEENVKKMIIQSSAVKVQKVATESFYLSPKRVSFLTW
jgi:hypothetical protein